MAFLIDTMTDTDGTLLTDHTGDSGVTWATHPVSSGQYTITNNQAWGSTIGLMIADAVPPTADYEIEAVIQSFGNTSQHWICGRVAPDADTCYFVNNFSGKWHLYRRVAGVNTELGTWDQIFTGGTRTILLSIVGSTIVVKVDGTERISAEDSAIPAAGRVGLRAVTGGTSANGHQVQSITATNRGNIPPSVNAGAGHTALTGQAWTRQVSFADDDSSSWTATVDYDDGDGPEGTVVDPDTKTVALSHTWATEGVYNITVSVEDDEGGVGSDTVQVTVSKVPTSGQYIVADVTGTDAAAPVVRLD